MGPGGGDLRTGYTGDDLVPPLELKWRFVTDDDTWTASTPAVDDEILVFAVAKTVYGVDPDSGQMKWEHETTDVVNSDITLGEELVLVGDHSGVLYGIEKDSGRRVFQYRTVDEDDQNVNTTMGMGTNANVQRNEAVESGFALVDEVIYFGDDQGIVHAVKATKEPVAGVGLWKFNAQQAIKVAPTYYRDALYVATLTEVIALQRIKSQGEQMWKADLGGGGRYILGSPVIANDRILVGVGDQVVALEATTGQVIWRAPAQGKVVGSPAIADGKVAFGCTAGLIYCVNLANGEQVWRANVNGLLPVDPDYAEYRQAIHTSVLVGGNTVYARTRTGTVVGVDLGSGDIVWRYDVGDLERPETSTMGAGGMGGMGSGGMGGPMGGGMGGGMGGPTGGMGGGIGGGMGGTQNYLGTSGTTLALDLSSGIAAAGDHLFVLGGKGNLYALRSGGVDSGPPVVKQAKVYIPRTDGVMQQTGYPIAVYNPEGYPDRIVSPMQMVDPSGALPSAGPIVIQAEVSDLGSGVVPESVQVTVQGPFTQCDYIYLDSKNMVQIFIPDRPEMTNRALPDGDYVVFVEATDYAGRTSVSEIRFTVDGDVPSPSAQQQGMGGMGMPGGGGGMGMPGGMGGR
jgi:outer membrane protein assembly factor BamB